MSCFVLVTFDLHGAKPVTYSTVQKALERVSFRKVVRGKKRVVRKLPSNTFVATFDSKETGDQPGKLARFASDELGRILVEQHLKGRTFAFAGQKWAWKWRHTGKRRLT